MAKPGKPVPDGYHTITPYFAVRGAAEAIAFYKKAFGAEERSIMKGPDGKIMHAELNIGNSILMMGEECPESGNNSPASLGGTTVGLMLYVNDVDASFARATAAGCKAQMPPTDMFWGDRYCKMTDPFGHSWSIATHKTDFTPEEMGRGMEEFMKKMAKPA
jgi:PhnB protein